MVGIMKNLISVVPTVLFLALVIGCAPYKAVESTVGAASNSSSATSVTVQLNGTVSDDGLPNNTLTKSWTQVSGPGVPVFENASNPKTKVTLSAPGHYVFRLSASDGSLVAHDDVVVDVVQ
jgi:hypothetical protein